MKISNLSFYSPYGSMSTAPECDFSIEHYDLMSTIAYVRALMKNKPLMRTSATYFVGLQYVQIYPHKVIFTY